MTRTGLDVSNPQSRRTSGRRKKLSKAWRSSEWKEQKEAFLMKNPFCSMHLEFRNKDGMHPAVPATIPHHPYKTSYKEGYSDLKLSQCVALCSRCHFAVHHGMRLCRKCGEHYHPWDAEMCKTCFDKEHPGLVEKREQAKAVHERITREKKKAQATKRRIAKNRHPCKFNRAGQHCGMKNKYCGVCSFSPMKAKKCEFFNQKKGVEESTSNGSA